MPACVPDFVDCQEQHGSKELGGRPRDVVFDVAESSADADNQAPKVQPEIRNIVMGLGQSPETLAVMHNGAECF